MIITPDEDNKLLQASAVQIDKITTVRRGKVGDRIGYVDAVTMAKVDRALATFLRLL